MKHISLFEKFLVDTVNLNKTRFDTATTGIGAITDFLKANNNLKDHFVKTTPQGSYRQKTIIRPPSEEFEFDVDLLFEMKIVEGWKAKDYLSNIAKEFKNTERYEDKVDTKGKSRCVTIDYESDFHIDIVPAIKTAAGHLIMNKNTNTFEVTDGDGYAVWFEGKSSITNGFLAKTVRLIKYIRDVKQKFIAKSILLTTLLGNMVYAGDDEAATLYSDLPATLLTLINRLDVYLQINPTVPNVTNPILSSESFNRHWNQEKYLEFRAAIHDLYSKINDAYAEDDEEESIKKWQLVFGEEFPEDLVTNKSVRLPIIRDKGEEFLSDLGIKEKIQYNLKINATVTQNGWRPFPLLPLTNILKKQFSLDFFIEPTTIPFPYQVLWKIKNYGDEATRAGDLRGGILKDNGHHTRKERTKYQGVHYAECYAIKDGVCIAKDRVDVPIGLF